MMRINPLQRYLLKLRADVKFHKARKVKVIVRGTTYDCSRRIKFKIHIHTPRGIRAQNKALELVILKNKRNFIK